MVPIKPKVICFRNFNSSLPFELKAGEGGREIGRSAQSVGEAHVKDFGDGERLRVLIAKNEQLA